MTRINNAGAEPAPDSTGLPSSRDGPAPAAPSSVPTKRTLPPQLAGLQTDLPRQSPPLPKRRHTTLLDPLIETPFDRYAFELILNEWQFNGSRPQERLLSQFTASSLRGDAPYWDLDERAIVAGGSKLELYGDARASPLRTDNGEIRVRLHYADEANRNRMTEAYGPPSGREPAFMRGSYRTAQVKTASGWQQFKFSMPRNRGFGLDAPHKALTPANIKTAVLFSEVLSGSPAYAREPAGLAFTLGDGGQPITQLWREMPVASRGFQPGDFAAPIHVLTAPEFAESAHGRRIFGLHRQLRSSPGDAQALWLVRELAPRLADILLDVFISTHAHPQLHEQNAELVVDADGHILDIIIKDLSDMALDYRAISAAGKIDRWRGLEMNEAAFAPPTTDELQFDAGDRYSVASFYRAFLGSIGTRVPEQSDEHTPSLVVVETARLLSDRVRQRLPVAWLQIRLDRRAHENAFGVDVTNPYERIAALRALIVEYIEAGGRP
ncbi:UNVERIFIED_ORG: hypothetical protein ABIC54_005952 [Burkholderia sp. 1263]